MNFFNKICGFVTIPTVTKYICECFEFQQDSVSMGFSEASSEMFNLGEKVLIDTKQARAQQERLHRIEEELASMQTTVEQEVNQSIVVV